MANFPGMVTQSKISTARFIEVQKSVDKPWSYDKNLFFFTEEKNGNNSYIFPQSTLQYILFLYQNPVREIVINA